jgi:4-amino-4-deoxy-L-arabinose transferase-like glycosyltransferase
MRLEAGETSNPLDQKPLRRWAIIAAIFAAAFVVRMYRIDQPLLDFHPTRQYRTAILARVYYYQGVESIPQWKKQLHTAYKNSIPLLEPPVGELVAASLYRIAGGEYLWLPRIASCVYWLVGGVFLYLIACRLISPSAAVFSTLFYLFWPYNIFIGRSIQPEAMMVMLFVLSIFLILRYYDRPTVTRLIPAAIAAGCAVLIKPYIIFPIYAAFISLGIFKLGVRDFVLSPKSVLFVVVSLLPAGA